MPRYPDVQTTRSPDPQISRRPDAKTLRFSHVKTPKCQIPKNWQIFWLEFCPTQNRSWTESVQLSWSWTVSVGQKHWKIRLDGKPGGHCPLDRRFTPVLSLMTKKFKIFRQLLKIQQAKPTELIYSWWAIFLVFIGCDHFDRKWTFEGVWARKG